MQNSCCCIWEYDWWFIFKDKWPCLFLSKSKDGTFRCFLISRINFLYFIYTTIPTSLSAEAPKNGCGLVTKKSTLFCSVIIKSGVLFVDLWFWFIAISHVLLLLVRIANNLSHSFLRVCCILCKCSLTFRGSSFSRTKGIPLIAFWLASSAFLKLPDFLITYRKSFHKWLSFCKNVMQRCWMIPYRTGNVFLFIFFLFGFNFLFSWWLKIIFMSSAYILWGNSGMAATVWLKVLFPRV